jgi:hypothetical protein
MAHPANRVNAIKVIRGQTKVISVKVKTKAGRNAKLADASLIMTVRKRQDMGVLITKTTPKASGIEVTDAGKGDAIITLDINDTGGLEAGEYRYDVWVIFPGSGDELDVRQPVVKFAQMHVEDGLTDFANS